MKHISAAGFIFIISMITSACGPGQPALGARNTPTPTTPVHKLVSTAIPFPKDAPAAPDDIFNAIDAGNLEAVKTLIQGGLAVDSVDNDGTTPLIWASAQGQLEIMSYLIAQGASLNNGRSSDQITPLIAATIKDKPEAVKLLLEKGAKVDLSANGSNALYQAAINGYVDVMNILLGAGADPNLFMPSGRDPLFATLDTSQTLALQSLIEHHANVNAVYSIDQPYPNSPLMVAAWRGNAEIIKTLIDHGARDPWLSGVQGFDPYHFSPLDVSLVNGQIMVSGGSQPLFLGDAFAQRPWVDPTALPQNTTGTNFFTWVDSSTHSEVAILIISDKANHKSQLSVKLPIYIADKGITYTAGIASVQDNGPFATLRVHTNAGLQGKIVLQRGKNSTDKAIEAKGLTTFDLTQVDQQNEPLTIKLYDAAATLVDTIEIDCIYRGASAAGVFYDAYQAKP